MIEVSQFRFFFVAFFFTMLLIFTVFLRNTNDRFFYERANYRVRINQLKQEIGVKHLQLEKIINPAAIQQHLENLENDS